MIINYLKKNWQVILTYILLIAGFSGFLISNEDIFIKYIMATLAIVCLYFSILKNNFEFLYYILLYLVIFCLYNFYELSNWPLWLVTGMVFIVLVFINWQIFANSNLSEKKDKLIFITILISLLNLEIYLSLLPWTTFARSKSIINLASFYALSGISIVYIQRQITTKKILAYLIISSILVILAVGTTLWYAY